MCHFFPDGIQCDTCRFFLGIMIYAGRKPAAAMTDDGHTTAADILRTCFGIDPAREEPPCPLPSGDIRFYRDFLSIDLLFRPERLLERYERDRDRREMPCHILKH